MKMFKRLGCDFDSECSSVRQIVLTLACIVMVSARASEFSDPLQTYSYGIKLQGFGTVGVTHSSSDSADYVRDVSQPAGARGGWTPVVDSLLGVQANYELEKSWEGVVQVASRYRYDKSYRPEVAWAFLKYDLTENLTLRLGRISPEVFMASDLRMVAYSYLPARLPPDYFNWVPVYYVDGADALINAPSQEGLYKFKIFFGRASEQIPVRERLWDSSGSRVIGAYADYLQGPWQVRLTYARLYYRKDFPGDELRSGLNLTGFPSAISAASALSTKDKSSHFASIGMFYEKDALQMQLMLATVKHDSALFENLRSGYAIVGYRLFPFTPYVGYSFARSYAKAITTGLHEVVPQFAELNAGVAAMMRSSHVDQHTFFAGIRWDVTSTTALKVQWDSVRGDQSSVAIQKNQAAGWNGQTNVLSISLDFVF